jgi:hypothetical protein
MIPLSPVPGAEPAQDLNPGADALPASDPASLRRMARFELSMENSNVSG